MSGLNPFRHKKAASTAGAVAATAREPSSSLPTLEPGSRPHGQEEERQAWQADSLSETAEEWLASVDTAIARQKESHRQQQDEGRAVFERALGLEEYPARPVSNSKTVRIASPPAKQIPSPDEGTDDAEELGSTMSEYTTLSSTSRQPSTYRVSTPGVELAEDPFNAVIGSSGSSDDDDDDDEDDINRFDTRNQDGLGLGLGPVGDLSSQRRVSYQGDLRSRDREQAGTAATKKRATMDVDAFKRLLLTGDTGTESTNDSRDPNIPSSSRETTQVNYGGQSQSTASNISNQQKSEKRPPKLPPPPPKSRRGKSISSGNSQSTDDIPTRTAEAPVSPSASHTTSYTKSPASSIHGVPPPSPLPRRQAAYSEPVPPSNAQLKRPPTPPLTRRHSQMKRSSANTSRLSLPTRPLNRSASLNSATNPKTPPPPPSRRTGAGSSTEHGSTTSSIADTSSLDVSIQHHKAESETSPQHHSHRHPHSINTHIQGHSHNHTPGSARPQPPPPRRTTGSSNSAHSADINSTPTRRPPSISTEADDHPLPPPPPPLRKSSRSSNTTVPDISAPSNANDILADLSRLQRELDEFRGQYGDGEVVRNRSQ